MRGRTDQQTQVAEVDRDDVTPESVAIMRERARPSLEGRTFRHISGLGTPSAPPGATGIRFDVA